MLMCDQNIFTKQFPLLFPLLYVIYSNLIFVSILNSNNKRITVSQYFIHIVIFKYSNRDSTNRQNSFTLLVSLLVGELDSFRSNLLLLDIKMTEVPLLEHEISHQDGGDKEVQRDEETEGSGGVGQRDVQSNDLLIFHLEELCSDLS